jgi:hypothetical protein
MSNPNDKAGKFVLSEKGVFKVRRQGGWSIFNADGKCPECCECHPYTLATFTTGGGTWDLTPYQDEKTAAPKRYWRLTNNYTGYVPVRRGCVDQNGKLVGLPDSISTTTYKYTWTFRIEIGCQEDTLIRYPTGTESASLYNCNEND